MTPQIDPVERHPLPVLHDLYYHIEDGAPVLDSVTDID